VANKRKYLAEAVLPDSISQMALRRTVTESIRPGACDDVQHGGCNNGADDLRDHVGGDIVRGKATAGGEPDGHGGIEMTARDVADRVGHGQHREPERQRHAQVADADLWEAGGDHRRSAASEREPESADKARTRSPSRRTRSRKRSCLISCSQPGPDGGAATGDGRHGRTNPAGVRRERMGRDVGRRPGTGNGTDWLWPRRPGFPGMSGVTSRDRVSQPEREPLRSTLICQTSAGLEITSESRPR